MSFECQPAHWEHLCVGRGWTAMRWALISTQADVEKMLKDGDNLEVKDSEGLEFIWNILDVGIGWRWPL